MRRRGGLNGAKVILDLDESNLLCYKAMMDVAVMADAARWSTSAGGQQTVQLKSLSIYYLLFIYLFIYFLLIIIIYIFPYFFFIFFSRLPHPRLSSVPSPPSAPPLRDKAQTSPSPHPPVFIAIELAAKPPSSHRSLSYLCIIIYNTTLYSHHPRNWFSSSNLDSLRVKHMSPSHIRPFQSRRHQ